MRTNAEVLQVFSSLRAFQTRRYVRYLNNSCRYANERLRVIGRLSVFLSQTEKPPRDRKVHRRTLDTDIRRSVLFYFRTSENNGDVGDSPPQESTLRSIYLTFDTPEDAPRTYRAVHRTNGERPGTRPAAGGTQRIESRYCTSEILFDVHSYYTRFYHSALALPVALSRYTATTGAFCNVNINVTSSRAHNAE